MLNLWQIILGWVIMLESRLCLWSFSYKHILTKVLLSQMNITP